MGSSSGAQVTHIQVNTFECGGIAIAVCISHKVLDGAALNTFLKAWSGIACKSEKVVDPDFVGSLLFYTDELWLKECINGHVGIIVQEREVYYKEICI